MKKVLLSSFNNDWYSIGAGKLKQILWYYINLLILKNSYIPFIGVKVKILRVFGAKVGKNVLIKPSVSIKYPWKLNLGNNVWIGENVWIDNLAKVTIEDNVCISQGAMLLCGNHNYKKPTFDLIEKEIVIEEGAWIGAQSTVCPGVICKSHSVLSVGSIATSDLEPYHIYQGVPATAVRKRIID